MTRFLFWLTIGAANYFFVFEFLRPALEMMYYAGLGLPTYHIMLTTVITKLFVSYILFATASALLIGEMTLRQPSRSKCYVWWSMMVITVVITVGTLLLVFYPNDWISNLPHGRTIITSEGFLPGLVFLFLSAAWWILWNTKFWRKPSQPMEA